MPTYRTPIFLTDEQHGSYYAVWAAGQCEIYLVDGCCKGVDKFVGYAEPSAPAGTLQRLARTAVTNMWRSYK